MNKTPLIIATRNAHKLGEIAQILPNYDIQGLHQHPASPEIEENADSFAGNAVLKAIGISALLPGIVMADDSGLCVNALNGAPGIYSARYAGEHGKDADNNAHLLAELGKRPLSESPFLAEFVCAICIAKDGKVLFEIEGRVQGHIRMEQQGKGGFGYDPLFVPNGYSESFAELPASLKNKISHRACALAKLSQQLPQIIQAQQD